jgi:hypothetical protein
MAFSAMLTGLPFTIAVVWAKPPVVATTMFLPELDKRGSHNGMVITKLFFLISAFTDCGIFVSFLVWLVGASLAPRYRARFSERDRSGA